MIHERIAEIAAGDALSPAPELLVERPIEAELRSHPRQRLGGDLRIGGELIEIAAWRLPDQQECRQRQQRDQRYGMRETPKKMEAESHVCLIKGHK